MPHSPNASKFLTLEGTNICACVLLCGSGTWMLTTLQAETRPRQSNKKKDEVCSYDPGPCRHLALSFPRKTLVLYDFQNLRSFNIKETQKETLKLL